MERMGPGPKGSEKPGRRAWKKEKEVTPAQKTAGGRPCQAEGDLGAEKRCRGAAGIWGASGPKGLFLRWKRLGFPSQIDHKHPLDSIIWQIFYFIDISQCFLGSWPIANSWGRQRMLEFSSISSHGWVASPFLWSWQQSGYCHRRERRTFSESWKIAKLLLASASL